MRSMTVDAVSPLKFLLLNLGSLVDDAHSGMRLA